MSQYRVVVPSVPQEDGSFKSKQTFYPTLEAAVEFVDEFVSGVYRITETVDVDMSAAAIAAARERIAARKAKAAK
jgi:hypothetical protein